jgi:molybdopterin-synthase adenylyltransferase
VVVAVTNEFEQRFERQTRFAPLARAGQARLESARVLIVGCGALGGALAQSLVRSGVGTLVLVDRDVVEESNLPRQVLFDERHAREARTKVEAARETLARIGGPTRLETHAAHLDVDNLAELARGADLVLDGTDNLETRYLVNDWCVEQGVRWIYAGVVGAGGLVLPVLPGAGPCLACVFPEPPPPGVLPTCDTAGVLQPAVALVAAMQAGLALRLLASPAGFEPRLHELDAWDGRARTIEIARDERCRVCVARDFRFLRESATNRAVSLCGRNTVQVRGARGEPDLEQLARRLDGLARDVRRSGPLLRFQVGEQRFTVFADGRALIEGLSDPERALALYDRYVGT